MVDCKYILPCGRCEKLGAPCDAPKECEHSWEAARFDMTNDDLFVYYVCNKCKATKVSSIKNLVDRTRDILGVIDVSFKT